MPGVIIKIKIGLSSIPEDTIKMLEVLENQMHNDDISKKEYCEKKWSLLKPHAEDNIVDQIQQLQADLESTNIEENDYCSEMMRILQVNLHIHSPIKGGGSPFLGDSTSPKFSGSPKTYDSKRKATEEAEETKPGPSTRRFSPMEVELVLENEDSNTNGDSPKGFVSPKRFVVGFGAANEDVKVGGFNSLEMEIRKKEAEEAELARLRKETVHKAQPMPKFKPVPVNEEVVSQSFPRL